MRSYLTILFLALCFGASAQNKIAVTAHRGDWRNAPENSIVGFQLAVKMGVDIIELDLQQTKDNEIVIMHDATINRTTEGKGKTTDYTLPEIRKFHLKNGLGRATAYNFIPTLEEAMLAVKGTGVLVNLDKSYPYFREAYQILQRTGTLDQAIFKAGVPFDSLKAKYPELIGKIRYMPIVDLDKPNARKVISDYLTGMKPYGFELNFTRDTSAILADNRFITQTGAKVWINSLWASLNAGHDDDLAVEKGDKKNSWDWIIAHGATIIQTDRPLLMLEYLRKRGLHQ